MDHFITQENFTDSEILSDMLLVSEAMEEIEESSRMERRTAVVHGRTNKMIKNAIGMWKGDVSDDVQKRVNRDANYKWSRSMNRAYKDAGPKGKEALVQYNDKIGSAEIKHHLDPKATPRRAEARLRKFNSESKRDRAIMASGESFTDIYNSIL